MAEETAEATEAVEEAAKAEEAPDSGFAPITSQDQLNAIIKDRLAREREKTRAKYSDYDELKERAASSEKLKADLDAANAKAEEAEASAAALREEAEREKTARAVAAEQGVDAELLLMMRADTKEELEEAATAIRERGARRPAYPNVYDGGASSTSPTSREAIESIKDPVQRVQARAQNAGLYRH